MRNRWTENPCGEVYLSDMKHLPLQEHDCISVGVYQTDSEVVFAAGQTNKYYMTAWDRWFKDEIPDSTLRSIRELAEYYLDNTGDL